MEYEPVIGLEVHVQLKTKTKIFCGCSTEFGQEPNSQTCPVCLGLPGTLPVLNKVALDHAIKVGLALNCQTREFTKFDRKHYYYPDLPKNFQISQYDLPISKDGFLDIELDGKTKRIAIRRCHLEEDAGKLIHKDEASLVDYNRTGMPLLEIVSEPELNSPQEAHEYLTSLKSIIEYLEVSDCDMEKGTLRCDANISLKEKGIKELGTKAELKNMNSFKAVRDALQFEIERQAELLNQGEAIIQETRLWDEKSGKTIPMRSKEEAKDYRYFPEPDLPPFVISKGEIAEIKKTIPELPKARYRRFIKELNLSAPSAGVLVFNKSRSEANFIEEILQEFPEAQRESAANWIISSVSASANSRNKEIDELMSKSNLIELIELVLTNQISNLVGKSVQEEAIDTGKSAAEIVKEKNLMQISDAGALDKDIDAAIQENPKVVQDYKAGKDSSIMFLVGQVMKKTKGKANPKVVQDILKRRLSDA